ncbi:hypothetical protein [Sphingomonas sp.]|uniref:hypothetical protein n=1 Tax=Sphingomonas sp. TaxID=28214 RepID=UPI003CC53757
MTQLTINATATRFNLSSVPAMPEIVLTAVMGEPPRPGAPPVPPTPLPPNAVLVWHVALAYPGFIAVAHGLTRPGRARTHPAIAPIMGNPARVPFTEVMGGRLTVRLEVTIGTQKLSATRDDILIGGTNPTAAELSAAVQTKLMRQMIQQESGGAQFNDGRGGLPATALNPNWSQDRLRGVGLGQLTNPPPSADDAWNWRTNAATLQVRFRGKRASGSTLHTRIMASARWTGEVGALNEWRRAEGQPPLHVTLPALTAEQQDWEGLRAYNGFGVKADGQYLDYIHEFEPLLTTLVSATRKAPNGQPMKSPPVPDVDAAGVGSWRQVTGAERNTRSGGQAPGDPNYVAHVLAQPG